MSLKEYVLPSIILALLLLFLAPLTFAQTLTKSYVPGEVIVKYKTSSPEESGRTFLSAKAQSKIAAKSLSIASSKNLRLKKSWGGIGTFHYKIESSKKVSDLISELKQDPDVEYAEPNYYVSATSAVKESQVLSAQDIDSYLASQNNSQEGAQAVYGQTGAPVQIPDSWALLPPTGTAPVVAVIDTGIDYTHPSLEDAMWKNPGEIPGNGIDDDHNGYIDDVYGYNFANKNSNVMDCNDHGTHVAGIIRGSTQNILPSGGSLPAGIHSSKVKIMAVKFLDCDGVGTTSDAVSAIYYAVQNGAKVLNNSWGGGGYSASLVSAIYYAYQNNAIFVAAAGNSGLNLDSSPMYPASYTVPNIISVAASNTFDYLPYFSNYGANSVHIAAPGVGILSTIPNNNYVSMSGTSMAAPFISGLSAMMLWAKPTMNGYQLKSLITSPTDIDQPFIDTNGNHLKDPDESYTLGNKVINNGRMNATKTMITTLVTPADSSQPAYDISAYARDPASTQGGGCGLVQKVYNDYDNDQRDASRNTNPLSVILVSLILMVPIITAFKLRANPHYKRRYDRFFLGSSVQIHIGQKDYLGSVGTISLGGLSFNSEATLKLGHSLELFVTSPNGNENLKANGQIVWMSNNNSYGVKFIDVAEETLIKISAWTKDLKKV